MKDSSHLQQKTQSTLAMKHLVKPQTSKKVQSISETTAIMMSHAMLEANAFRRPHPKNMVNKLFHSLLELFLEIQRFILRIRLILASNSLKFCED